MKKYVVLLLSALILMGGITACKDDDDVPTFSTERPITAFFDDNSISDPTEYDDFTNAGYWEFGFEFSVIKKGEITELGVKIPDDDVARVTIWEMEDTTIIAQKNISAAEGVATYEELASSVPLVTGKKYAVTVLSDDYYLRTRSGGVSYTYPVVKGNVTITRFVFGSRISTSPAVYPENPELSYISGLQDFTFRTQD